MAAPIPFITSASALNPDTMVPVEKVISVDTLDVIDANVASNSKFQIIFTVDSYNSAPKQIFWNYVDAATRDLAYADVVSNCSTALV
jgi:hypothetical protein